MPSPSPDQSMRQFYRLALTIAAGWKASQKPESEESHDSSQSLQMKIHYVNYKREYPGSNCFKQWFYIRRYWSGKLIHIGVRHHAIVIDIRKNWIADVTTAAELTNRERDLQAAAATADREVGRAMNFLLDASALLHVAGNACARIRIQQALNRLEDAMRYLPET